jgi:hypothetical protein
MQYWKQDRAAKQIFFRWTILRVLTQPPWIDRQDSQVLDILVINSTYCTNNYFSSLYITSWYPWHQHLPGTSIWMVWMSNYIIVTNFHLFYKNNYFRMIFTQCSTIFVIVMYCLPRPGHLSQHAKQQKWPYALLTAKHFQTQLTKKVREI